MSFAGRNLRGILVLVGLAGLGMRNSEGRGEDPRSTWKFDFGSESPKEGYERVSPECVYGKDAEFGFERGGKIVAIAREGTDGVGRDFCTSETPFLFSVNVPEGNYRVTVLLGDPHGSSNNTIKAENRQLMVHRVRTAPGVLTRVAFTVNVHGPDIEAGRRVRLKDREADYLRWDDRLTLEFNGDRPCVCALEIEPDREAVTLFLLGDSTVTDQPAEPWNSWGQMLPGFFSAGLAVANHAESGESLKSSLSAGRLDKVLSQIRPADHVFLQFGHNDQKEKGEGIGAFSSYTSSLKLFVDRIRERGGIPVLITPMHRRTFDAGGRIQNSLGDYPEAVRRLARKENLPLIDLHDSSARFYDSLGPEGSKTAFVDNTHHNNYGSFELARCVVDGIKSNNLTLACWLNLTGRDRFDPSAPDPLTRFQMPPSPQISTRRPAGN